MKRVYVCEDTVDNIFTAIYNAFESRYGHSNIQIVVKTKDYCNQTMELFVEYIEVITDLTKSKKVARSIKEKISEYGYQMVCSGIATNRTDKGDIVYRFLIAGFHIGPTIVDYLQMDAVMNLFDLNRKVTREIQFYMGFVRFIEDERGVFISKISPENDIIRNLAGHFMNRLTNENFIIYDENRNSAIIHGRGKEYIYVEVDGTEFLEHYNKAQYDEEYETLWKAFFKSVCIEERRNHKLQRSLLPLKYRKNMTEFINE